MIRLVHRPGRVVTPALPPRPVVLPAPPHLQDTGTRQPFPFQMLMPLAGAGSSMLMMTLLRSNPVFALLGAVVMTVTVIAMLAALVSRRAAQTRQRRERRERYLDSLVAADEEAGRLGRQLRAQAYRTHPAPGALARWALSPVRR